MNNSYSNNNQIWKTVFWGGLALKLAAMALFSSDYQNRLFIPFVSRFLDHGGNPWEYVYHHPETGLEFARSWGLEMSHISFQGILNFRMELIA